jgi:hypothetical protein
VPLETWHRAQAAVERGEGTGFDMLDLEPDKLPREAL